MKIKLKNTPEQQELLLKIIQGDGEAKNRLIEYSSPIYEQILKEKKLNFWECDWLPIEKLEFTAKIEIPVSIVRKIPRKLRNKE